MAKDKEPKGGKPDYEVGYGKPPVGKRFQKGVSGNPRGPRKKPRELVDVLPSLLMRKQDVVVDGKRQRRVMFELLGMRALKDAANGDYKPLTQLARIAESAGGFGPSPEDLAIEKRVNDFMTTEYVDMEVLSWLLLAVGIIQKDKWGRPELTDVGVERIFPADFDPSERRRLLQSHRDQVAARISRNVLDDVEPPPPTPPKYPPY